MSDQRLQLLLAFGFGVVFVTTLIVLAVAIPNPPATTFYIFRVVIALAAAGVGAVIPGLLIVHVGKVVRAGGALGLFVLVYLINPPALIAPEDSDLVERGEIALQQGDQASSVTLFKQALTFNPTNWRAYSGIGRAYYSRYEYEKSAKAFRKAIELSENKEWAPIIGLAMTQEVTNIKESLNTLNSVMAMIPSGSPAFLTALFDRGRIEVSIWLQTEAPKSTTLVKDGAADLESFLDKGGFPTQWAYYHLACVNATESLDNSLTKNDRQTYQNKAHNLLLKSVNLLEQYRSQKAKYQQELMRSLLQGNLETHTPGDPILCPALVDYWAELKIDHDSLPLYMTKASTL